MSTYKPVNNSATEKKLNRIHRASSEILIADRMAIRKKIHHFRHKITKLPPEKQEQDLLSLEKQLKEAKERFHGRKKKLPRPSFDENLPITAHKDTIIKAIQDNSVVIIAGETGSGKTTQLPKLCLEAGRGHYGRIGCTQPRRIAALSVAERIAEELHTALGEAVGCKVRFRDQTGEDTIIKLMTDGMLLSETLSDPFLNQYDTLIIDEAHERSLNIDFLLGFLIRVTQKRKDLKVIITSATIDTEKFSLAFGGAPIISVSGRMYPVEVRYQPQPEEEEKDSPSLADQVARAIDDLVTEGPFGDILVFLPTEYDIREACDLLSGRNYKGAVILPLYARLTGSQQRRVFQPASGRKIVVATNVAETSLTIPGIRYVVDTGVARVPRYIPGMRSTSLPIIPISKSSADQRKGRCGRVANGICIRLYSEESYEARERFTTPEILRANLADVLLKMTALRLGDIRDFPFVDRPADRLIKDGYDILQELGAIVPVKSTKKEASGFALTSVGKRMASIPLDPRIARMLVAAEELGCVEDVAIIAAGITAVDPRERPEDKKQQALQAQKAFVDPLSDFITLLNIWKKFIEESRGSLGISPLKKFTERFFLSFKRMREWRDLSLQILEMLEETDIKAEKTQPPETAPDVSSPFSPRYEAIHKAILTGHLSNIARRKEKNTLLASRNREVMIFPGSGLFNKNPDWIVAAEMVETSRLFARCLASIDPLWVVEAGGNMITESLYDPHWEKNKGRVMAFRRRSLYGLILTDRESVAFGKEDPETATRIFIQNALVQGELKQRPPFLLHNLKVVEEVLAKEDRLRRRDLFAGENAVFDFYAPKIKGIFDIRTLLSEIRKKGDDTYLRMEEKDILLGDTDAKTLNLYPEKVSLGKKELFPCSYSFSPGEDSDGISVRIPIDLSPEINPHETEWLIPGLFCEKIEAMLKSLPKIIRKRLVPLPDTAKEIAKELKPVGRPLALALSRFLYQRYNVDVAPARFNEIDLPDHLRMRLCLTDSSGKVLSVSRDPSILRENIQNTRKNMHLERLREKWEKDTVTIRDLDGMPETIPVNPENPSSEPAFTAFISTEKGVGRSLFASRAEARYHHEKAIARLLENELKSEMAQLKKHLTLPADTGEILLHFGGREAFEQNLKEAVCTPMTKLDIRSEKAFLNALSKAKNSLIPEGRKLMEAVLPVLYAAQKTRDVFYSFRKKGGVKTISFLAEMDQEMKRLIPENFVKLYSAERMMQFPRYLKAMIIRIQRASEDFSKDERKQTEIKPYEKSLREILSELSPHVSEEKKNETENLFWMIEEFKVSVFAQEVGALGPVSAKRLKEQIRRIQNLV
ncbi:ATP-dependent helicase HrpA [Desulfobotulus alkaliphilus]|uniref:ATP-dependent helicase HrpA n=1 Tax=Desulfobotulus alkaliphilus TaxID=622671 RepID=A0A562RD22_9BACT|nr:ATP-dependent RNA helicase HrpA [Desulfobotulus alkaliphilus]TWI66918.1 ATP-dependent helicase HrpA [Desulfobotulus alkaliphilus]